MTLVLYIAEIKGVDTYTKPGITTDLYSRTNAYTKIGNTAVIHFLAIAQPGFEGQIRTLEEDGKTYLKPHRSRFNGLDRTEYISVSKTGITPSVVEDIAVCFAANKSC